VRDEDVVEARKASTVMIVSEHNSELVVLLLERNVALEFVGGAYVFPGGKVDASDASAEIERRCAGRTDKSASQVLELDHGGLSYFVAGIRECYEESGILLARADGSGLLSDSGAEYVDLLVAENRRVVARYRQALLRDECDFETVVKELGLVLACDRLNYVAHWITPVSSPRRYDTRFFVVVTDQCPDPIVDKGEVVTYLWTTPALALERAKAHELTMILPTIRNLEALSDYASLEQLREDLMRPRKVPTVVPVVGGIGQGDEITIPVEIDTRWSQRPLPSAVEPQWRGSAGE
jgi:8-oxo-dGTP pyrophosphatase MutT (NUDIX family)